MRVNLRAVGSSDLVPGLFTGQDPAHGSGHEVFKTSRVGSGWAKRYSKSHGSSRVGSVRVGFGGPIRPDPRALTRPVNSVDILYLCVNAPYIRVVCFTSPPEDKKKKKKLRSASSLFEHGLALVGLAGSLIPLARRPCLCRGGIETSRFSDVPSLSAHEDDTETGAQLL